jgi:ferredoxin, 2Fe-2S
MTKITYVEASGTRKVVDVKNGTTLMHGAVLNGVKGIEAECGGNCMCATCHVYIEPSQFDLLPAKSDDEDAMLGSTASPNKDNSRLSCQVKVTDKLEGLVVYLPERQS